jgi:cyclopropane-fatty-acyl-phospholipid synthase
MGLTSRSPSEILAETALSHMRAGRLTLVRRDGTERVFVGEHPGPEARVVLKEPRAARRAVAGGSLGLARGYMEGDWDTPDLDAVLDVGISHYLHEPATYRSASTPLTRLWHALRDNTINGSRRNIAHHYDLGNDFYRLWLDETMTYSSALFESGEEQLDAAQVRKWDRMLEILQPSSSDHLLEIGCGWGGFAMHAASRAGCKVTGLTISEEQAAWARYSVEQRGLEHLVDVRLQDYRHVPSGFTGIASIEMFEAVGERWWPVFFNRLRELLPKGSVAALQTITIDDSRLQDYRENPDFTQRYIFPGGMLPSPEVFQAVAAEHKLTTAEPFFFGPSYARTLSEWSARFEASLPAIRELGFDDRFVRMWRYYLSYCRAGFSAGTIDVMQVRLEH